MQLQEKRLFLKLKQIIESSDTRAGKAFDLFIQALILLSLVSFSLETLPDLSEDFRRFLLNTELVLVVIFSVEYLLRLWVAERKAGFVFSFFGLIDLLAILPFFLSAGVDLRSLRVLRMLRLFRILKLVRYSTAVRRFHKAFMLVREELILFGFVTLIILYLAAVGIYHFENEAQPEVFSSVFHSLWWAVITLTTVGYGDLYPVTLGGRVFTFFILMIGLSIVAVPTGLIASALSKAREDDEKT